MATPESNGLLSKERRRFPRYPVSYKLTLAIEDESLKESIGIGEPQDISLGGLRVANLPSCTNVRIGNQLGLLLFDGDDALSLTAEVIQCATNDTFGIKFRELTNHDQKAVAEFIRRLHARHQAANRSTDSEQRNN